ncbi:linear amide C-N hydrolase [Isosphaeraceae bacterium EP7]
MSKMKRRTCVAMLAAVSILASAGVALPCSRVLWSGGGRGVYVGRNMDWMEDMKSNLWVLPRGMARDGLAAVNPLRWRSKYGSLVITGYDSVSADGLNEKGLAAHMLYLAETKVGPRDEATPGLAISMWLQYYLDQFGSVAEAVAATESKPFQLLMVTEPSSKQAGAVHIALDDSSGDSAIFECIDGQIRVYHDRNALVMTNEPAFDKQEANLRQYKGFGGDKPLPGTDEPADRFVRAAYYVKHLPAAADERESIAALLSVMRNVSAPFGVTDPARPNVSATQWRAVTNLTGGVLYYDSVTNPGVFWVNMKAFDFDESAPVTKLQVAGVEDLGGDVSSRFKPTEMFKFVAPTRAD